MRVERGWRRAGILALAGLWWAGAGLGQNASAPPAQQAPQSGDGQQAAPQGGAPGKTVPGATGTGGQAAPAPAPAPASDNAFPEAQSEAAAKEAEAADRDAEKAGSAGPAETPDGGGAESSSRSRMKGIDLLGDHDKAASNGAGGVVSNPQLSKDDVRIGQLYMGEGNYPGAYERFKEATQVGPANVEAVFYLAEAARKTTHLDEAAANYQLYLEGDPKGKHAKDAKKALAQLAGK